MSSSLPASLAAALSVAGSSGGTWEDLAGELRLFMEAQQDALDATRILNINLSQEVDQLKAQLLAIPTSGPSAGTRGSSEPKLSKIFSDPGNFDGSPGKKFKDGGHVSAAGDMKTPLLSLTAKQSPPCFHVW